MANNIDVKRYDRQIRLWGLESQVKMSQARILLLGANGLANEIAKNLVLAGVGHVCIQDEGVVDDAFLATGGVFSISPENNKGSHTADALVTQLKEMNPTVELTSMREAVADLTAERLRAFHFIIGTRGADAVQDVAAVTSLLESLGGGENADPPSAPADCEPPAKRPRAATGASTAGGAVARSNGAHLVLPMRRAASTASQAVLPRFLAAGTLGIDGFCFFDLGAPTALIPPKKKGGKDDAPGGGGGKDAAAPHTSEQALYPTIASAAAVEWAALTVRVPPLYYGLQLLTASRTADASASAAAAGAAAKGATEAAAAALPANATAATKELLATMLRQRAAHLEAASSNAQATKLLTDEYLAKLATASAIELAPVCAIVGGLIASEVLKVISGKERPINNALFFDGTTSDGVVLRLGPAFDCPWGVDKGAFKEFRPNSV